VYKDVSHIRVRRDIEEKRKGNSRCKNTMDCFKKYKKCVKEDGEDKTKQYLSSMCNRL
jgi:hypothetical protein